MRVERLKLKNFTCFEDEEIVFSKPVSVFLGPNGSGKTSIRDAIQFILTGQARYRLKKNAEKLVRSGAEKMAIEMSIGGTTIRRSPTSCTHTKKDIEALVGCEETVLGAALEVETFLHLDRDERKKLLYRLLGIELDRDSILAILKAEGIPELYIAELVQQEDLSPKALEAYAVAQRRADKRLAQNDMDFDPEATVTTAGGPKRIKDLDPDKLSRALEKLAAEHQDYVEQLGLLKLGNIEELKTRRAEVEAELARLREERKRITDSAARTAVNRKALEKAKRTVAAKREALERIQKVCDRLLAKMEALDGWKRGKCPYIADIECPITDEQVQATAKGYLAESQKIEPMLEKAKREYKEAETALRQAEAACLGDARDTEGAIIDAKIDSLEAEREHLAEAIGKTGNLGSFEELSAKIEELNKRIEQGREIIGQVQAWRRQREEYERAVKQKQTALEGAEVWDRIARIFAPDGIIGRKVAEGLKPVRERLRAQKLLQNVEIGDDMRLSVGGIDEVALSRSERFRLGLVVSDALIRLSGLRFLVVDELNMLDEHCRGQAIGWLLQLAHSGDYDQIIVLAVPQGPLPARLPSEMEVFLLERGKVCCECQIDNLGYTQEKIK